MTKFAVIRHGQTTFNAQHRWQGWLDSPLTELGIEQAKEAAKKVRRLRFDRIIVSPQGRALQTMEIIKPFLQDHENLSVEIVEDIKERHVGHLQGIPTSEILERFPDEMKMRFADPLAWHPKDGESSKQFIDRVIGALKHLATKYPEESLLVVAHGGICAQWHRFLTGADPLDAWEYKIPNGALSQYQYDGVTSVCDFTEIKPRDESMNWIAS